jgi:hypothetical protein
LRGRTAVKPLAQAAEIEVRRRTGLSGIADVIATSVDGEVVTVRAAGDVFRVELSEGVGDEEEETRCAGPLRPVRFVVRSLERVAGAI